MTSEVGNPSTSGSVPEAWVVLPPEHSLRGVFGSWGEPARGVRTRVARARGTGRNLVALLPAAAQMAQSAGTSIGRRFRYDFGFLPVMGRLLIAHPGFGLPFLVTYSRLMFGPSVLTRAEREAIAAVSAAAQDCFY